MENSILHIDMNNFYASVECLFHPEYKDVPMAVAGDRENRHGIILAKNILAKEKGVKTAETIWQAERKCPGLLLVKPHFDRYAEYSRKAKEIYLEYTDRVESFGMDECWLDISGSEMLFGTGEEIAHTLRLRIKQELGLTVSIGVSFNKIFAKLGSDYKKPDAVTVFSKDNYKDVVWKLPVRELLFVGRRTADSLAKYDIKTIGQLANSSPSFLRRQLGKMGDQLWRSANGLDGSQVTTVAEEEGVKTIGNSMTLPRDISSEAEISLVFLELAEKVSARMRRRGLKCMEIQISLRSKDFKDLQRQCRLETAACDSETIHKTAMLLYKKLGCKWEIRAAGVRAGALTAEAQEQLSLYGSKEEGKRREKLETAVDSLRDKFGSGSIKRAVFYEAENLAKKDSGAE